MSDQFEFPHVDERNDMPSYQELEAEVERLRKRHEADEEQLCEISRFLGGRDARHVVEDGRPRTIATLAIQEIERLRAQVKLWKPMTQPKSDWELLRDAYLANVVLPLKGDEFWVETEAKFRQLRAERDGGAGWTVMPPGWSPIGTNSTKGAT